MILDGTLIPIDRCAEQTISVKGEAIDAWYSGKAHQHAGNLQALSAPDGLPLWISEVEPGSVHVSKVVPACLPGQPHDRHSANRPSGPSTPLCRSPAWLTDPVRDAVPATRRQLRSCTEMQTFMRARRSLADCFPYGRHRPRWLASRRPQKCAIWQRHVHGRHPPSCQR
ncbi:transposase family protein [Nonomuraea sp. NPDC000554]|uniref:transposase family protein n=1 Tax=Nonomuraea sp. NPDC000554 TaxID=3154259 RepID=UPI00332C9402